MCGIAVLLLPAGSPDRSREVEYALNVLRHRGPDEGRLVALGASPQRLGSSAAPRAILGFRRLAIQDLSPSGSQPMSDRSGRYTIVFNGEIYNHDELRTELQREGESFQSRSDTEVLLRLLMRQGVSALSRLDGMFALALHDNETQRVLVARDPFGIKPLYVCALPGGALALASEIKAFSAFTGWQARANRARCVDFLFRGLLDHTSETMFDGVTQVPPGGYIDISLADGAVASTSGTWYELKPRMPLVSASDWPAQVRDLLNESVRRQLRADVAVGSCLSGGVDSSSIVAIAARERARLGGEPLRTITARPRAGAVDEGRYAALVANATGSHATDVFLDADQLWERLGELVWTQDEPFSSTSIFAQSCVFREARAQGLVVMLDGQGADEAFAGYPVFSRHGLVERLLHADVNGSLAHLRGVKTYTGAGIARQLTAAAACLAPNWIRRATSPFMSSSRLMESLFDAQSLGGLGTDPFARLGRCATVRACSLQQIQAASLPMLLHWEDRNSMSSSIEARVPFLSPVLVETALGLPYWAKVNGGVTKSILREAMRGTVPDEILDRRDKVGFEAPERTWLTGSGTSATMNTMVDRALEHVDHVLTPSGRARITEIRAGNRTYDRVLWRLICMGVWIERFAVRW